MLYILSFTTFKLHIVPIALPFYSRDIFSRTWVPFSRLPSLEQRFQRLLLGKNACLSLGVIFCILKIKGSMMFF